MKLWKHHAAQPQADRINALAEERGEAWLPRYGGLISSEWEFAKGLQLLEEDPEVYDRMDRWVEAADWIVWQLCGELRPQRLHRRLQGHPAGRPLPVAGLSSAALAPGFERFVADKLEHEIGQLGDRAGGLTAEAAEWTGLPEGIAVAVGNVDAHVTAPAAQAVEPGQMVAIMGTSTCHVMNADLLREVPGMCGVVDGGIVAGSWGYEAGQSGVGDIFGWFVDRAVPAEYAAAAERGGGVGARAPHPARRRAGGRRARAGRARLALAATARCWSTTSSPVSWSGSRSPPGPRTSTARCSRRPRSAPA